ERKTPFFDQFCITNVVLRLEITTKPEMHTLSDLIDSELNRCLHARGHSSRAFTSISRACKRSTIRSKCVRKVQSRSYGREGCVATMPRAAKSRCSARGSSL